MSDKVPPVGTIEWERAGGPPLSFGQRLALLGGSGAILASHFGGRLRWRLRRLGLPSRARRRVDLVALAPPDTAATRDAEAFLRDVSSPQMVNHSLRTYYFSAVLSELSAAKARVDREVLFVAAAMHDVGLFDPSPPPTDHCFTVGCARKARAIATRAGWDEGRQDRMAAAITSNLNPFVGIDLFGVEAHFLSLGGRVEVLAEEWKIHPDDVVEILDRFPRRGFADDALGHVDAERRRNPGCRFACLHPLFPMMVRRSRFSLETG